MDLSTIDEDSPATPEEYEENSEFTEIVVPSTEENETTSAEEIIVNESESEQANVTIAVIDTGIDINHLMLVNKIFVNTEELNSDSDADCNGYTGDVSGWDFVNNSNQVYNSDLGLDQAHGTHIAGIIAQTAPNVKILPLKVFENGSAYTSDIIRAISYAESMGATIVNCSWGSTENKPGIKRSH